MRTKVIILLLLVLAHSCATQGSATARDPNVLVVGGLGISGKATFDRTFNLTFGKYLTETVGAKINKTFVHRYLDFSTTYSAVENNEIDLIYTNPSVFACLENEFGVRAIVSIVQNRQTGSRTRVPLSQFGGTFFTRSDRTDLNDIPDIANQRLEGVDVIGLGAGQAQWREMVSRGLSFWDLPKQLIFSHDQTSIVFDVIAGRADVGMVRTDLIEGLSGQGRVNYSDIKYIGVKKTPGFPFNSSTQLYPEWPVAALPHLDANTIKLVSEALQAITPSSLIATVGNYATFVPPLSYLTLYKMQGELGWISNGTCIRSDDTYQTIVCPAGTYKKSRELVATECQTMSLECKAGYDCVCRPCVAVPKTEVDVFLLPGNDSGALDALALAPPVACQLLKVCLTVEQNSVVTVVLRDNLLDARPQLGRPLISTVEFKYYGTAEGPAAPFQPVGPWEGDNHIFLLTFATPVKGVMFLEVNIDGEPMRGSPLVVAVEAVACAGRIAAPLENGTCVCPPGYLRFDAGAEEPCAPLALAESLAAGANLRAIVPPVVLGTLALLVAITAFASRRARDLAEKSWRHPAAELDVSSSQVLGRGSFGLVITANYRGTLVALKRGTQHIGKKHARFMSMSVPTSLVVALTGGKELHFSHLFGHKADAGPQQPSHDGHCSVMDLHRIMVNAGGVNHVRKSASGAGTGPGTATSPSPNTSDTGAEGKRISGGEISTYLKYSEPAAIDGLRTVVVAPSAPSKRSSLPSQQGRSSVTSVRGSSKPSARGGSWKQSSSHSDTGGPPSTSSGGGTIGLEFLGGGKAAATERSKGTSGWLQGFSPWQLVMSEEAIKARHQRRQFLKEVRLMVSLRHPQIVQVIGAVLEGQEPILVMQFMQFGSCHDLIRNESIILEPEMIIQILCDVTAGMTFLHAAVPHPLIHSDIKAANILVDEKFRAKVADFGLTSKQSAGKVMKGTPFWMAPEVLRGEGASTASDVYSFGVTVYEVWSRKDPYPGLSTAEVLQKVADPTLDPPFRPVLDSAATPAQVRDLCSRCWLSDPAGRPTFQQLSVELRLMNVSDINSSMKAMMQTERTMRKRLDVDKALALKQSALLHKVFPPAVAAALLEDRQVEPQPFREVTIFFSDIIGFTNLAAKLTPEEVVNMLDRLYTVFDEVTERHGLFKVETIGDAYMCVGNIREEGLSTDHCYRVGLFALEAVAAAQTVSVLENDPDMGYLSIRAGFHSGPVVASVVGRATPRFCLFGDTVNTASRMESNSLRNSITISPEAAELLRKQAPHMGPQIVPRGLVEVKGKGLLELYLLKASGAGRLGIPASRSSGAAGLAAKLAPPDTIAEVPEAEGLHGQGPEAPSGSSARLIWVDEGTEGPGRRRKP